MWKSLLSSECKLVGCAYFLLNRSGFFSNVSDNVLKDKEPIICCLTSNRLSLFLQLSLLVTQMTHSY